ncbi:uncharacterized protein B0H18DRAFT_92597 [Fomitopsis serialis]|uniref:uncharacterized protein n=1 Tax=Fomitopsis serialis TaxID=139415 RepID=UPI0020076D01|nr:uncharacterized protein B0H18DRAFT_92597 [Neoantrodia serialis]KAH9915649.1 hypothetical protein B0H18DRAFT_92597 [Neoantrodia serialis]
MDRAESITTAVSTSEGSSHGPAIPRLPVEVCERIIDYVAAGWDTGYPIAKGEPHLTTLTSCALVCQDWYFLTWYHLRQRIHLRDRTDVLSLSKTLRAKPRLREVIQQVVISGASPGKRQAIPHLGTFAAMLAGKAPRLSRITIEDAEWTIGSVRMEDIGFLGVFSYIDTLNISKVTLSSVAQLSHLVSALPRLRKLWCFEVDCLQKQHVSPASLPLNCANLEHLDVRWVAPAVEDVFVHISRASRVRILELGVPNEVNASSAASRSQTMLDASSTSAELVQLHIALSSPVRDDAIDATVERHCNLSHHDHLRRLDIHLWYPFADWLWIPHILSRIVSKHFQAMAIVLYLLIDQMAEDLDGLLTTMEQDDVLVRLDYTLQEKRFSGTIASRGFCIGIHDEETLWMSGTELSGMGSAKRERYDRWDELVRRKMPHSHGRGILRYVVLWSWSNREGKLRVPRSTVHNFLEFISWIQDMEEIHRQSMQAEQKNTAGEDAHPLAKGPQGSTD